MSTKILKSLLTALFGATLMSCGSGTNSRPANDKTVSIHYAEKFRPQFHFSPETGWMNDPNGLVFLAGEYHLFYQYYPDSTVWGPMHWGHAVSKDLVHWTHLPVALYPDSLGYIFSGSAVVDEGNTSSLGSSNNPAIVAVFTYHNPKLEHRGSNAYQSQGIACSTDKGRTWTKYSGNPVLLSPGKKDFRDPKVFWYKETGRWIMILAVYDRVHIYSSPDLKSWTFESEFGVNAGAHGGVWECPDLFPLRVAESGEIKWVMLVSINPGGPDSGSATQYFTGSFDGHHYIPDTVNERWIDQGTDNYAGVTWSGIPETDGRRLFIGWMSNWNYATAVPTDVWRSAMTIPRELSLIKENDNYLLVSEPLRELETLRTEEKSLLPVNKNKVSGKIISVENLKLSQCELNFEFNLGKEFKDTLKLVAKNNQGGKLIVGYSGVTDQVFIDRTRSGISSFSERFVPVAKAPYKASDVLKMRVFIDASSAELFVDDGKLVMTTIFFPEQNYSTLYFSAGNEKIIPVKAKFYQLASIWR